MQRWNVWQTFFADCVSFTCFIRLYSHWQYKLANQRARIRSVIVKIATTSLSFRHHAIASFCMFIQVPNVRADNFMHWIIRSQKISNLLELLPHFSFPSSLRSVISLGYKLRCLKIINSISSPVYVTRKSREICVRTSAFSCLLTFKAFGLA